MKRNVMLMIVTAMLLCGTVSPASAARVDVVLNGGLEGSVLVEVTTHWLGLMSGSSSKCYDSRGTYTKEYTLLNVSKIVVKRFYYKGCGALLDKYKTPVVDSWDAPFWNTPWSHFKVNVDSDSVHFQEK